MLSQLSLKDFAIVEQLSIHFNEGMSALTGETGAGKSIAIDALQFALGARADTGIVRHSKEQADIAAIFDITRIARAKEWLTQHEFPMADNEVLLRRVITREGRSRQTINGEPCTQQQLRELGELLVNIHGQHEHQSLLKKDQQRELVDQFGKHEALLKPVQTLYREWQATQKERAQLEQDVGEKNAKLTLLEHYVSEFEAMALEDGELVVLETEHKQLANSTELSAALQKSLLLLSEEPETNAQNLLAAAQQTLSDVAAYSPQLATIAELLDSSAIQLQEAIADLQDYSAQLDMNPERLQIIEARLSALYALARKHHTTPDKLLSLQSELTTQLKTLQHADEHKIQLDQKMVVLQEKYQQAAQALSQQRKKTVAQLTKQITTQMQTLGMPGGKFAIELEPLAEMSAHGNERIEFLVSANPGHPLQSLNKVASGGELSRISLAVQMLTAQRDDTPTLIFDEVDSGIGGATAEVVGQLLKQLGKQAQVICITHLAQVAAQAQHHWHVKKEITNDQTKTGMVLLDEPARIQEIARMIGGVKITASTLKNAAEMLSL